MAQFPRLHEARDLFRQALTLTEGESGFAQRLVEKDYYCSLILADFEPLFARGLVFKGGTSLSKVHANFYRLSEDLDFAISVTTTAHRRERSAAAAPIRAHLEGIAERVPAVEIADRLEGHNNSRQYVGSLRYTSVVTGERETVKIEVALREPIIEPTIFCTGRTLLRPSVLVETADSGVSVCVLSLHETYAEKVRAALTREPPAIRDLFDVADAVASKRLDLCEPRLLNLVRQKLQVTNYAASDTSEGWRRSLREQLPTQLKPVLRSRDFEAFDVDWAFAELEKIVTLLRNR